MFLPGGIMEGVRRIVSLFNRPPRSDASSAMRTQPAE
jgi:hypothetical protein